MLRPELSIDMARFLGKTVTIFTTSGGISGAGFTGVLAFVDDRVVRLITRFGAAPACPIGSSCTDNFGGNFGGNWGWGGGFGNWGWGGGDRCCRRTCGGGFGNILGSVTEIPSPATNYTQLERAYSADFPKQEVHGYIFIPTCNQNNPML